MKNRIAMLRRGANLNQKELGERLGVGQTTVSAWETGKNEPDSAALMKMADLFGATIGYIMGHEPESYTRGHTPEEYERRKEMDILRREMERKQADCHDGLTQEEKDEITHDANMELWENGSKADTLEGFLAGSMVDALPQEKRKWAISILQQILYPPKG